MSGRQTKTDERRPTVRTGYRGALLAGLTAILLLFGGVFGWMASASISGAVVASGHVMVRGKPKSIQHLDGGIVEEIAVRNGQTVERGDLLVRLDDTLLLANLEIYRNRLREALSRKSRLEAERDGADEISFEDELSERYGLGGTEIHRTGQVRLFEARRASREGQVEQLRQKIGQFRNQTSGVEGLIEAKRKQLELIEKELVGLNTLFEKGLAAGTRVMAQERARAELVGELSEHQAELARIDNAIRETEISILQIEREAQEAILSELREVSTQVDDLVQQIIATDKQLERVEIRAPVAGIVHELSVHTLGGVVPPGGTLMQVIAMEEGVEFEVAVEPYFIDQLYPGQRAAVRFPAFNQRTTPELTGTVEAISASSVINESSGLSFYRVGISVPPEEQQRLAGLQLVPGMPVEAFIETEPRTMISYMFKPLTDQFHRALREE